MLIRNVRNTSDYALLLNRLTYKTGGKQAGVKFTLLMTLSLSTSNSDSFDGLSCWFFNAAMHCRPNVLSIIQNFTRSDRFIFADMRPKNTNNKVSKANKSRTLLRQSITSYQLSYFRQTCGANSYLYSLLTRQSRRGNWFSSMCIWPYKDSMKISLASQDLDVSVTQANQKSCVKFEGIS